MSYRRRLVPSFFLLPPIITACTHSLNPPVLLSSFINTEPPCTIPTPSINKLQRCLDLIPSHLRIRSPVPPRWHHETQKVLIQLLTQSRVLHPTLVQSQHKRHCRPQPLVALVWGEVDTRQRLVFLDSALQITRRHSHGPLLLHHRWLALVVRVLSRLGNGNGSSEEGTGFVKSAGSMRLQEGAEKEEGNGCATLADGIGQR